MSFGTFRRVYGDNFGGEADNYWFDGVSEVYSGDVKAFVMDDHVEGMTQDGEYVIRYDFRSKNNHGSDNPGSWVEWKYVRADNGTSRTLYVRQYDGPKSPDDPSWRSEEYEGGNDPDEIYLHPSMPLRIYQNDMLSKFGMEIVEAKFPGKWEVKRSLTGPVNSYVDELVTEFDIRMLQIRNLRSEEPEFEPDSDRPTAKIKADIYALPASWQPAEVHVQLEMADQFSLDSVLDSRTFSTVSNSGGFLFAYELEWDGKLRGHPEPTPGDYTFRLGASTVTGYTPTSSSPIGTGAYHKTVDVKVVECDCACEQTPDGGFQWSIPLDYFFQVSLGISSGSVLSYCSKRSNNPPTSLGSGWKSTSTTRVLEPADQNGALIYRGENGGSLRWNLENGIYVPSKPSNRAEIEKTSDPDATYVVTFPDQVRQEFDSDGLLKRTLDRNDNAVTYAYSAGHLASVTDSHGTTIHWDYGGRSDGQPTRLYALDREVLLEYDLEGRLSQITDPVGDTVEIVYDTEGRIHQLKDTSGAVAVEIEYNARGMVASEIHYGLRKIETFYGFEAYQQASIWGFDGWDTYPNPYADPPSSNGQKRWRDVTTVETDLSPDPDPERVRISRYDHLNILRERHEHVGSGLWNRTDFGYTDSNDLHLLTAISLPNTRSLFYLYNDEQNLKQIQDGEKNTHYLYPEDMEDPPNPKHRNLVRKIEGEGGQHIEFRYDSSGNLVEVVDEHGRSTLLTVNAQGQVTSVTNRIGKTVEFGYTNGRLTSVTEPADSADEVSRTTALDYDAFGNLTSVEDALGNETTWVYDKLNRLVQMTDPMGESYDFVYENGLLVEVEGPPNQGSGNLRRRTRLEYDIARRLESVTAEVAEDEFQLRVGYAYSGFSQLRELSRLQGELTKACRYEYDNLGRLVEFRDFLERVTQWEYAPYCVENTVTTPRGVRRTSSYDVTCQLTQIETQRTLKTFEYDERDRLIQTKSGDRYRWQDGGERYGLAASAHKTSYTYEMLNLPAEISGSLRYEYNFEGMLVKMLAPWNTESAHMETEYAYFDDGRLKQVKFGDSTPGSQGGAEFHYKYDLAGRLISVTVPDIELETFYEWNARGDLLSLSYWRFGQHFHKFQYAYDAAGNRTQMIEMSLNSAIVATWDYGYDWLDRLTSVHKDEELVAVYSYDESDNRIEFRLPQEEKVWTYEYDAADQLLSRSLAEGEDPAAIFETYSYDADGNMITRDSVVDGLRTYVWDDDNRLRKTLTSGTRYLYDIGGIRRQTLEGEPVAKETHRSSGGMSLYDLQTTQQEDRYYIQGHQLLGLRLRNQEPRTYYFITDGLGNVRMVLDDGLSSNPEDGIVATYEPDEFGNPRTVSGDPAFLDHTYVGALGVRNEMGSQGLLYMQQRWYDPSLGRFLTPDPIGFAGGLNLYGYVGNNPVRWADSEGLRKIEFTSGSYPYRPIAIYDTDTREFTQVNQPSYSPVCPTKSGRETFEEMYGHPVPWMTEDWAPLFIIGGSIYAMHRLSRLSAPANKIHGPYASTTKQSLEKLARSGGSTTQVITNLSCPPKSGRALSTATGKNARELASKARGSQEYVFNIPNGLLQELERTGLAVRSTTSFGGVVGTEIRFAPPALEHVLPFQE